MMTGSERAAARLRMIDTVGRLMEFWGFRAPLGRVWTLLYLSPEPLAAAEVGAALRMSTGAVSSALGELVEWGAARKVWRPGARSLYEAESDVWRAVTRVLRERELPLVREAAAVFEQADAALGSEDHAGAAFERARIATLASAARVAEALLADIAGARGVNAGASAQEIVVALAALTSLSPRAEGEVDVEVDVEVAAVKERR